MELPMLHFPLRSFFLAIPLIGPARKKYKEFQALLEPFSECMRFQPAATAHLTLMFWPEVLELEYDGIVKQSEKIAAASSPFDLRVTGIGTFGNRGRDSALFLGVEYSPELSKLKKHCPWSEGKPFHPHITLARIKHPERFTIEKKRVMKVLKNAQFSFSIDRIRLYAEVEGKKQTPLDEFVF